MDINATCIDNVTTVAVKGRVDSANADGLKDHLSEIIDSGSARLIIDLKDVNYISSTGFRALLIAARAIERTGGRMVLCGISKDIQRLFDIAAFSDLFTILPTRDDAVAALR